MSRGEHKAKVFNWRRVLQFRLRTLLLLMFLVAVILALRTVIDRHRAAAVAAILRTLDESRAERDAAQQEWKVTYEKISGGIMPAIAESNARVKYFAARKRLENAKSMLKFYGVSENDFVVTTDSNSGMKKLVPRN